MPTYSSLMLLSSSLSTSLGLIYFLDNASSSLDREHTIKPPDPPPIDQYNDIESLVAPLFKWVQKTREVVGTLVGVLIDPCRTCFQFFIVGSTFVA